MKLLAQSQFGNIDNPFRVLSPSSPLASGTTGSGVVILLQTSIRFVIVVSSLYAFFNLIMAGWGFISAGGDPKNVQKAWEKIWQSLIGLLIIAGSFVLATIIGYLVFGPDNAMLLISPRIYTP